MRQRISLCHAHFCKLLVAVTVACVPSLLMAATPTEPLPGLVPAPAELPGVGRWQMVQTLPVGYLWAAAWSPDGKQIALGDSQNVRLCDPQTLATTQFLVGHTDRVTAIAYNKDGSQIATSSYDGTIRLWARDGSPQRVLKGHEAPVQGVCWSPDGKQLASAGDDGTARIWDLEGNVVVTFKDHEAPVGCIAWSSDGELLASGDANRMVRLWSREGKQLAVCEGHHGKVKCICWSPDGQTVASGDEGFKDPIDNSYSSGIRFWKRDGQEKNVIELTSPVVALAYSPDGERLASGSEVGSTQLWSKEGQPLNSLAGSSLAVAWNPDSQMVVTTGKSQAMVSGIDRSVRASFTRNQGRRYVTVAWSPDGNYLAAHPLGGELRVYRSDGQAGPSFNEPVANMTGVTWSADSRRLLAGMGDELRILNIDGTAGEPLKDVERRSDRIVWTADGARIAVANSYNAAVSPIQLRDSDGKLLHTLDGHAGGTTMLAWSFDGKHLASSGRDGAIRLWSSEGEPGAVMEGRTRDVDSITWCPDNQRIVAGYDSGDFQFWNIDGTPGMEVLAHDSSIMYCQFSPDGKYLATGSWDESIKLWNLKGEQIRKLAGHVGPLYSLSWHPDGKRLASGSYDATARVWNTETGETQFVIFTFGENESLAITRTGEIHGGSDELIAREFLFLVEKPNGATEILSHAEFKKRTAATN